MRISLFFTFICLAPLSQASASAETVADAHSERLIRVYHENLSSELFRSLKCLREVPSPARVASALRIAWLEDYFLDRSGDATPSQRVAFALYDAYGEAQSELIQALVMACYESPERQEQLWMQTLEAQAALKELYPEAARQLPDLIALVDEVWQREQRRPIAEREQAYRARQQQLDAEAMREGRTRFHQHSPAMQQWLREYLCRALESEMVLFAQLPPIDAKRVLDRVKQSWRDDYEILQSIDASGLSDEQREALSCYLALSGELLASVEKATDRASFEQCEEAFKKKYGDAFVNNEFHIKRPMLLLEILGHDDLVDYRYHLYQYDGELDSPIMCFIHRRLIEALKKKNPDHPRF